MQSFSSSSTQALSTIFQVVGAFAKGQAASNASKYNAAQATRKAGLAVEQAASDADAKRRDTVRRLGLMRANYGASGVTVEGSPLDVMAESAANAEMDALNIKYKGDLAASGYAAEAKLDKMRARQDYMGGLFGAGSALLTGISKQVE